MNFILNAGVSNNNQHYINDKIKIANQVALLMSAVGLFYAIFSYVFYPTLTIYPVFCTALSFGAIWLNSIGWHNISRFILSTLVILLAYIYHGFLVQPGEDYITSMYMIEFSLSVIPWVLIDIREKLLLPISLFACYMFIFTQSWANKALSMELDSTMFREGWLNFASIIFGVLILIFCLMFMQKKKLQSDIENDNLLLDIKEKNEEMEQQQEVLHKNLEEVKAARIIEEKQNWVSKGMADISEILRQESGEQIYAKLLRAIVKYIDANQGGMYLVKKDHENENFLELAACFAYDREKFVTKKIEIGQGLVGQCYLEKEIIILKEVPEEYIIITSGLGDSPPSFIAIIPLIHDEYVLGVLEVALFHELEKYQLDLLAKLGESIASFVSTNSLNIQTKTLLEQSQIQMEQLHAQEEEMRQNMEELQATQEEMQRKEKEYIQRIEELEEREVLSSK